MRDPLRFLRTMRAQHGGLVTMVLGGQRVVLASDPAAVHQIVQEQSRDWQKDGTAFFPGSALAGNGLLVSDGAVWQRQRRLCNPAFRQSAARCRASAQ